MSGPDYFWDGDRQVLLRRLVQDDLVDLHPNQAFEAIDFPGTVLVATGEILVELQPGSRGFLESFLQRYAVELVAQSDDQLVVSVGAVERTLEVANKMHDDAGVLGARPNWSHRSR